MNLRRACCCTECECGGCDFASSYYAGGAEISGSWNFNSKFNPCTHYPCGGQEEDFNLDVDVVLSAVFVGGTLTRTGSVACCYRRTGTATVTYSVTITARGRCCADATGCTHTLTVTGSKNVEYRLTVVPICVAGKLCSWVHTLGLCAFDIGVHDYWDQITAADCPLNCDELPLNRRGLVIEGCVMQWRTPYQALDTLVYGDFAFQGFCGGSEWECGGVNPSAVSLGGYPFSIWSVADWGGTPPGNCPTVLTAATPAAFYSGEFPGMSPCSGDAELDTQCYSREFHFTATPPLYT